MLDAIASERADRAAELAGAIGSRRFRREGSTRRVLPYSPGYCGWHVSGQRKLFDFLRPEEIGMTLNASCLMQPLKSVSGVLVAGARPRSTTSTTTTTSAVPAARITAARGSRRSTTDRRQPTSGGGGWRS